MAVYVDDFKGKFGRMIMSHMIADTTQELMDMVQAIGVHPKWIQKAGTYREHFDICQSKCKLALAKGAIPITWLELGRKIGRASCRERV